MQLYVAGYHNTFIRFLHGMFVQMPLEIWFRFITAYWPSSVQFVNCSGVSDAVLAQQWALAQQGLANAPFPLNYAGGPLSPRSATFNSSLDRLWDTYSRHSTAVPMNTHPALGS